MQQVVAFSRSACRKRGLKFNLSSISSASTGPVPKDHRQWLRKQTQQVVFLGRQKQWEKALQTLDKSPFPPDVKLMTAVCGALERASAWQQVLHLHCTEPLTQRDERFLGLATSACAKGRAWRLALVLATSGDGEGLGRLQTANAVLNSLDYSGEWQHALQLLYHGMVAGDVVSYSCVVSAMARMAQWQQALAVLMDLGVHDADEVTLASAVSACDKGNEWERACALLKDMPRHISLVAVNSALSACGRGHRWEMACQLIREMFDWSIQPDMVSYTTTVTSCNRSRQWLKALELYHFFLRLRGGTANLVLYSAALKACQLGTQWQQALALFQEMQDVDQWPDIAAFNPCLGALVEFKKWEEALALVARMPSLALQPNSGTKRLLLHASEDHWQGSLEIMLGG